MKTPVPKHVLSARPVLWSFRPLKSRIVHGWTKRSPGDHRQVWQQLARLPFLVRAVYCGVVHYLVRC